MSYRQLCDASPQQAASQSWPSDNDSDLVELAQRGHAACWPGRFWRKLLEDATEIGGAFLEDRGQQLSIFLPAEKER